MSDAPPTVEDFERLFGLMPPGFWLPRGEISVGTEDGPDGRCIRIVKGGDRVVVITHEGDRLAFAYHRIDNGYQPLADPAFERETPTLFARALGHVRATAADLAAQREAALHEPVPEALDAIARLLVRGPELAGALEELSLCRRDKAEYVKRYAQPRNGIDEVIPGLGWIALIDALKACDVVCEIDWRAEWEDEVAPELERLVARALPGRRIAWPDEVGELETGEALVRASSALAGTGYAMINLCGENDSYEVALVPEAAIAELTVLARKAGREI